LQQNAQERTTMLRATQFDCLLVGGGLQNALIAMALLDRRPQTRFAIIERESRLGGNHLWCFHARDVPDEAHAFVDPLVAYRWPAYEVAFPNLTRRLDLAYAGITSDRLHQVVTERVAASASAAIFHDVAVEEVTANKVQLADGRALEATLVIDSRGPEHLQALGQMAYQKFVGLEVALAEPRAEFMPKLMATDSSTPCPSRQIAFSSRTPTTPTPQISIARTYAARFSPTRNALACVLRRFCARNRACYLSPPELKQRRFARVYWWAAMPAGGFTPPRATRSRSHSV
jgi:hypothetical protein